MRKHTNSFLALTVLILASLQLRAGNTDNPSSPASSTHTHYINAPRFVRPLIDRWITEYESLHPSEHFAIASNATEKEESTLSIQLSESGNGVSSSTTFFFGRYAVIPVTAEGSEASKLLEKKSLNAKRLKSLFFENEEYNDPREKDKIAEQIVLYTGSGTFSVATHYAEHFNHDASSFRGKRIVGDDAFLNTAIAKDSKGVAINTLPNIFDLQSRQIKSGLSTVPLEGTKAISGSEGSLDELISLLESRKIDAVPTSKIGLQANSIDEVVRDFISWILSEGVRHNHRYGLLDLDAKERAQEARKASNAVTATLVAQR